MPSKVYSEERLVKLIDIANLYIAEPQIRKGMVSKFHEEIGNLVTGAGLKSTIGLSTQEVSVLKAAYFVREKRRANQRPWMLVDRQVEVQPP